MDNWWLKTLWNEGTGPYPEPQDLTGTQNSPLASHGAMNTPDCSYRLPVGQEKAAAEADQLSQPKSDTEI